jgi:hypothetical protein
MPRVVFETTTLTFEWAKTVRVLDGVANLNFVTANNFFEKCLWLNLFSMKSSYLIFSNGRIYCLSLNFMVVFYKFSLTQMSVMWWCALTPTVCCGRMVCENEFLKTSHNSKQFPHSNECK